MQGLPEPVVAFVVAYIDSVDQLEVLLLLWRNAERSWSAAETSTELRTSDLAAGLTLEHLRDQGLAESDAAPVPRFRFPAENQMLRSQLEQVASTYQERRVAMITLIYTKPEAAGPDPVRLFADAFKLTSKGSGKKDGKHG